MAAYPLKTVQELVAAGKYRLGYKNTIYKVAEVLETETPGDAERENKARALILETLASLSVDNLSRKPWPALGPRPAMDEYGVRDGQGRSWYVKFWVKDECVQLCSFHALEHDLETVGGRVPR